MSRSDSEFENADVTESVPDHVSAPPAVPILDFRDSSNSPTCCRNSTIDISVSSDSMLDHKEDTYMFGKLLEAIASGEEAEKALNVVNVANETLLHLAVRHRLLNVLELLCKYQDKIAVNVYDKDGLAPLHVVIKRAQSSSKILSMLLAFQEIDVNIKSNNSIASSPLHLAIDHRSSYAVEKLLEAKAEAEILNGKGLTPLEYCNAYLNSESMSKNSAMRTELRYIKGYLEAEKSAHSNVNPSKQSCNQSQESGPFAKKARIR